MYNGQTVFSQIMDFLPIKKFRRCVDRYNGNYRVRSFTCFDQLLCMAFAQITSRQSLRDIETCLRAMQSKLYHCGFRGNVSRTTLAKANENRNWRIYADFAHILINKARKLYSDDDFGIQLNREVYALDSTTIDLCLSLFPWAKFRKHKAAVKLHTLMNLKGSIPTFIRITDGKVHDVNILDELILEPGPFILWIVATSTSLVFIPSLIISPCLSPGPKAISIIAVFTITKSTRLLVCDAIKR